MPNRSTDPGSPRSRERSDDDAGGMRGDLIPWMAARGGVAHSSALRAAGFTTHGIRHAIAHGAARWVRRSWLAIDGADPALVSAAARGGRLTCLSASLRAGLWTPDHGDIHLAVKPSSSRVETTGTRVHWAVAPVPVPATELVDTVINALFHVAGCVPLVDALCVWESAIRTGAVAAGMLPGIAWRGRARELAEMASHLSDSGLETRFIALVTPLGVPVRQQVWIDGHPVDALLGERLVVQLDGFAHHQASDRRRDLRADATHPPRVHGAPLRPRAAAAPSGRSPRDRRAGPGAAAPPRVAVMGVDAVIT